MPRCTLQRGMIACTLLLAACSRASVPTSTTSDSNFHFSIRGRLAAARVRTRLITTEAPVSREALAEACRIASAVWNETGAATIQPEADEEDATSSLVLISFEREVHGPCTPFGRDPSIAHTGPCGAQTYIHLDAERDWSTDPALLARTLAHEFGHALGLGHSIDPTALMNPEDAADRAQPSRSDLAGLHSLYGGGADSEDDLGLFAGDCAHARQRLLALRGVAPRAGSQAALFDTDGDGREELLVWRTGDVRQDALTIYSFDENLALVKSLGPLRSICPPEATIRFGVTAEGERLLVRILASGRVHALAFDDYGEPRQRKAVAFALPEFSDLDGDWNLDAPMLQPAATTCGSPWIASGDFNRDGRRESWRRLESEHAQ